MIGVNAVEFARSSHNLRFEMLSRIVAERSEHDCFVERNLYDLAVHCNV